MGRCWTMNYISVCLVVFCIGFIQVKGHAEQTRGHFPGRDNRQGIDLDSAYDVSLHLQHKLLKDFKHLKNQMASMQADAVNQDYPSDNTPRRLDTLDWFGKSQTQLLRGKLEEHDGYLRMLTQLFKDELKSIARRIENGLETQEEQLKRIESRLDELNDTLALEHFVHHEELDATRRKTDQLIKGDVALVKASDNTTRCGYDTCYKAMTKLLTAFSELNDKQEEQKKDFEEVKANLSEIYSRQTKDLEEVKTNLREMHGRQAKDVEEVKAILNRNLASTASISTQLEKHSTDLLSHDDRLKAAVAIENNTHECVAQPLPTDCSDIRKGGSSVSGVYRVYPGRLENRREIDVYCDFSSVGQSWLVFQRRKDGSVNFERNWVDYANGFGDLTGEFWLGNEKLSQLSMNKKYKLRVELEDFDGMKSFSEHSNFSVNPATDKYRLTVGGYTGTAGGDSMIWHNGMQFTTSDADNDKDSTRNCAVASRGAWWYNACLHSNPNGLYLRGSHTSYADGVEWYSWRGVQYSLKATEMKITAI